MFKWLLLFLLISTGAWAQNPTCPTRPTTDSTNACASTAFVHNAIASPGAILTVPNGGTGVGTFTPNEPILGNGTNPLIQASGIIYTSATTMATALTACGTSGECTLTANVSLTANATGTNACPAGLTLDIPSGIEITQSAAFDITFNCHLKARQSQIFSGFTPGQITFGPDSVPVMWAEWWGASPSASSTINTPAFQSGLDACFGGPPLRFGVGTYTVKGTGTQSATNGAALLNNTVTNPSALACDFGGMGMWGISTLKNDASSSYNILEMEVGALTQVPFTVHDMTFDGNYPNNTQQTAGDRYQNCFYAQIITGLTMYNIECEHGTFHGIALNSMGMTNLYNVFTHNNASVGLLMTTGVSLNGFGNQIQVTTYDNGLGHTSTGYQVDCSDIGAYFNGQIQSHFIIVSYNNFQAASTNCTQTANAQPGGVTITNGYNSTYDIVSNDDREALMLDNGANNNTITLTANVPTDTCLTDIEGSGFVEGNKINIICTNAGVNWMRLGGSGGSFEYNQFSGMTLQNLTGSTAAGISINTGFIGNNFVGGSVGDIHAASNISYLVGGAGSGGSNNFTGISCVGTNFTSAVSTGLVTSDKANTNYNNCSGFTR